MMATIFLLRSLKKFDLSCRIPATILFPRRSFCSETPMFYDNYIGLSVGSSNAYVSVSYVNKNKMVGVEVLKSPSVVFIAPNGGSPVTGQSGLYWSARIPKNSITGINRLIGRRFDDPVVQKEIDNVPYQILKSIDKTVSIIAHDTMYHPVQILACILNAQIGNVEKCTGKSFSNSVITVPDNWNDYQVVCVKEAASMAGLTDALVMSEPVAIAAAFDIHKKVGVSVILDLGARTFDFCLFQTTHDGLKKIASNNEEFLGGADFDKLIIKYIFDKFRKSKSIGVGSASVIRNEVKCCESFNKFHPKNNGSVYQIIRMAAEQAKKQLSEKENVEIVLPQLTYDEALPLFVGQSPLGSVKSPKPDLSRSQFEKMVSPLLNRIRDHCTISLEKAGFTAMQVDEVYLVGGMANVPCVRDVIKQVFGKFPITNLNPEVSLSHGAATVMDPSHVTIYRLPHDASGGTVLPA